MTSAFISYSKIDHQEAEFVYEKLSERGVDVFIYQHESKPGLFWKSLAAEIRKRDFFLVLLSPNAAKSTWVQREIGWALQAKPDAAIIPIVVLPLSMDDWEPVFPLIPFQHIDLTGWPNPHRIIQPMLMLFRYLGLPSSPRTLPYAEPFEEIEERERMEEEEEEEPWLSLADIRQLLNAAESAEKKGAPRALFLYRQSLESLRGYVNRLSALS